MSRIFYRVYVHLLPVSCSKHYEHNIGIYRKGECGIKVACKMLYSLLS